MKILLFLVALSLISISPVFGEMNLSNERIESTDGNLILQFADNTIKHFRTHISVISNIEYGIVDIGMDMFLDDARVNIMGNSFTVKNDNMVLYAKSLGDDKFTINAYYATDSGLQKKTFTANIIEPAPTVYSEPEYIAPEPIIQMFTWMESTVQINDDLTVKVKVTDDKSNRGLNTPDGGIYDAKVTILTGQFGNQLRSDSGTTNIYGEYAGAIRLISAVYEYEEYIDVTVIVEWNDQYLSKDYKVWVVTSEGS